MYAHEMNARPKSGRTGRPSFPIDDDWLAAVNAWIEREGRGAHARLARAAGIEPGTLSGLLSGRQRHSVAVPSINKMVGLPMPTVASGTIDESDAVAQLAMARAQLDSDDAMMVDEQIEAALKLARRLLSRRKPTT